MIAFFSALYSSSVVADVVAIAGKPPLVNTQVLRLADGKLHARDGGREVAVPIARVEYMQITGWRLFNLAEKQRRTKDLHRAIASYERALADLRIAEETSAPTADDTASSDTGLDRKLLLECRLIQACDAHSRFERALELYLHVIGRMPAVIETLRPTRFPSEGAAWLENADRLIDAAIARHGNDAISESLQAYKRSFPRPATQPADATGPAGIDPAVRLEIANVRELIAAGRYDEALPRIADLHARVGGCARADLFYLQGRAAELAIPPATAATQPGVPRRDAAIARAGLAYMRVVVHFPGHPLAAECLYRSARLCRDAGRDEQARTLVNELTTVYPRATAADGKRWADKAREELTP